MKRFFAILLTLLTVIAFSACASGVQNDDAAPVSTDDRSDDIPVSETPETEEGTVTVQGETFKLSYDTNHGDLCYKEDTVNFERETMGSFREIRYYKNGELLFAIHLVYYEGKTIEDVMAESDNALSEKSVGGLDYGYFEYDENGMPGHTWLYTFNGTTYSISFASDYDISALEDAFMNNVRFEPQN